MFSSMFTDNRSVGASTADFGIFTGLLAMIFVNWSAFDGNQQLEQTRCILIFMVVIMIFLNFSMTMGGDSTVDTYGHLGGALTGLIYGLAIFPRNRSQGGSKLRGIGLFLTGMYFTVNIILLYLVREPSPIYPF